MKMCMRIMRIRSIDGPARLMTHWKSENQPRNVFYILNVSGSNNMK